MNKKLQPKIDILARPSLWVSAAFVVASTVFGGVVHALELGHSRVTSAPGRPLVVTVALRGITPAEANSLNVQLPDASVWQAAGVKPPVTLGSLKVSVLPGRDQQSRIVQLQSPDVPNSGVVDLLLSVTTANSSRVLQTTVIAPPPPKVRLSGEVVTVQRGDTLIGISQQFPVQGATLYQQLWALYSTNQKAFIRENMNLLKSGASLQIPDAASVRAIDPAFAKAQYLAHVRAFRQGMGGGQGNQGIAAQATPQTLKEPEQKPQQGKVEAVPKPAATAPLNDQVRLSSAASGTQAGSTGAAQVAADQQTSEAKARAEELARKQALEKNVQALQGALAASGSQDAQNAAGKAGTSGTSGASGASGASVSSDASNAAVASASGASAAAGGASKAGTSGSASGAQGSGSVASSGSDASKAGTSTAGTSNADASTAKDSKSGGSTSGDAKEKAGASGSSAGADVSKDPVARIGEWVKTNTMAALAILLAVIAIVLAWILRSSKSRTEDAKVTQTQAVAAAGFEQKLKEIDLTLDQGKPDSPAGEASSKA